MWEFTYPDTHTGLRAAKSAISLLWNFLIIEGLGYTSIVLILDTDVVEDGRDSPEAIIGVHVSNFMRLN